MPRHWYTSPYSIVLFFVAGAAVATSGLFFLLIPQSSEVVRIAMWRTFSAGRFFLEANVQYHGSASPSANVAAQRRDFVIETAGTVDRRVPADVKADHDFRLTLGQTKPAVLGGKYRRAAAADYFRFTEMPDVLGGLHLGVLRDRTLRVNLREALSATTLPLVGGEARLKDEDSAYLLAEVRATPFLQVTEKLRNEKLRGVAVHHYKVLPEILYAKQLAIQYEERRRGRELTPAERLSYDTFFADLVAEDGEIWIGAGDYFIRRLRLRFRIAGERNQGIVSVTLDFSRFNDAAVTAPPDAAGVEDAAPYLRSLLASLAAHLPMAKDGNAAVGSAARRDGLPVETYALGESDDDHDGLSLTLETFYGSDPNNPDTDGDGVPDGAEVEAGRSPTGPGRLFDFTGGQFE